MNFVLKRFRDLILTHEKFKFQIWIGCVSMCRWLIVYCFWAISFTNESIGTKFPVTGWRAWSCLLWSSSISAFWVPYKYLPGDRRQNLARIVFILIDWTKINKFGAKCWIFYTILTFLNSSTWLWGEACRFGSWRTLRWRHLLHHPVKLNFGNFICRMKFT